MRPTLCLLTLLALGCGKRETDQAAVAPPPPPDDLVPAGATVRKSDLTQRQYIEIVAPVAECHWQVREQAPLLKGSVNVIIEVAADGKARRVEVRPVQLEMADIAHCSEPLLAKATYRKGHGDYRIELPVKLGSPSRPGLGP